MITCKLQLKPNSKNSGVITIPNPIETAQNSNKDLQYSNVDRLEEVVSGTKYDDLKIKLALSDEKYYEIKPIRPSCKNDEENDENAKESREKSDDQWNI